MLSAVQGSAKAICVTSCPKNATLVDAADFDIGAIIGDQEKISSMLVCAYKGLYDPSLDPVADIDEYWRTNYAWDIVSDNPTEPMRVLDYCAPVVLPTSSALNRCLPNFNAEGAQASVRAYVNDSRVHLIVSRRPCRSLAHPIPTQSTIPARGSRAGSTRRSRPSSPWSGAIYRGAHRG